jgi:hydrogenase maturation protease
MTRALLVFGWGNLSRGDDALGPMCVERLRAQAGSDAQIEFLDDYQLQVEHALDLLDRERVLFVDASLDAPAPFEVLPVHAAVERSISTHALSPQALLQVYRGLHGVEPPPCTLLAIRGEAFELGVAPSRAGLAHLDAAVRWASAWLAASAQPLAKGASRACGIWRAAAAPAFAIPNRG